MSDEKFCEQCGGAFTKPRTYSYEQWASRAFCSRACRGLASRRGRIDREGRVKVWTDAGIRWRSHVNAEKAIGRALRPGEVVDHLNGDPTDDRPENLRVFPNHAEHMRAHWREGTIQRVPGVEGVTRAVREDWPENREKARDAA